MAKLFMERVENMVGKRVNAGYQHFLIVGKEENAGYHNVFKSPCFRIVNPFPHNDTF